MVDSEQVMMVVKMKWLFVLLLIIALPALARAQPTTINSIQIGGAGNTITAYAPATYFGWLAPASSPPSERTCAEEIAYTPESVPNNVLMNETVPSGTQMSAFYANPYGNGGHYLANIADYADITGNYPFYLALWNPPTTDMTIRWSACKWGIDEDVLRGMLMAESGWNGATAGNLQTTSGGCTATGLTTTIYNTQLSVPNGDFLWVPNGCWTNYGIDQISATAVPTTFPGSMNSIPFSADYAAGLIRQCIRGEAVAYFQAQGTCVATGSGGHGNCNTSTGTDLYEGCTVARIDNSWWSPTDVTFWNSIASIIAAKSWPGGLG